MLDEVKELNKNEKVLFFIQYEHDNRSIPLGILLSLFLGFTGIQKFYLGVVRAGVRQV